MAKVARIIVMVGEDDGNNGVLEPVEIVGQIKLDDGKIIVPMLSNINTFVGESLVRANHEFDKKQMQKGY